MLDTFGLASYFMWWSSQYGRCVLLYLECIILMEKEGRQYWKMDRVWVRFNVDGFGIPYSLMMQLCSSCAFFIHINSRKYEKDKMSLEKLEGCDDTWLSCLYVIILLLNMMVCECLWAQCRCGHGNHQRRIHVEEGSSNSLYNLELECMIYDIHGEVDDTQLQLRELDAKVQVVLDWCEHMALLLNAPPLATIAGMCPVVPIPLRQPGNDSIQCSS